MFALPLIVVGQTDSTRVRAIALLIVGIGIAYTAGRWFDEIRNSGGSTGLGFIPNEPQTIVQSSLFLLTTGDLICRRYGRRLRCINWRHPLHVRRMLSPDDVKIEVA